MSDNGKKLISSASEIDWSLAPEGTESIAFKADGEGAWWGCRNPSIEYDGWISTEVPTSDKTAINGANYWKIAPYRIDTSVINWKNSLVIRPSENPMMDEKANITLGQLIIDTHTDEICICEQTRYSSTYKSLKAGEIFELLKKAPDFEEWQQQRKELLVEEQWKKMTAPQIIVCPAEQREGGSSSYSNAKLLSRGGEAQVAITFRGRDYTTSEFLESDDD